MLRYLYRVHTRGGVSNVYTHLSAIAFHFRRQRRPSPCDDQAVKMFMKGLKRLEAARVVKRAKPITVSMIKKAISSLTDTGTMREWRTVWCLTISFCCFLRWDDLKRVKVSPRECCILKIDHVKQIINDCRWVTSRWKATSTARSTDCDYTGAKPTNPTSLIFALSLRQEA